MVIAVDDRPTPLLELLWIREAYGLRPAGDDLPPALVEAPRLDPIDTTVDARHEWEHAWPSLWAAAVLHAGKEFDPSVHERLKQTANGSRERRDALQELFGPNWRDRFGPDALDRASYRSWDEANFRAKIASRPAFLESNPLMRDVGAVERAWRAGMTEISTIPCEGEHTRRVGDNALLITENTMTSSGSFRPAVERFG